MFINGTKVKTTGVVAIKNFENFNETFEEVQWEGHGSCLSATRNIIVLG